MPSCWDKGRPWDSRCDLGLQEGVGEWLPGGDGPALPECVALQHGSRKVSCRSHLVFFCLSGLLLVEMVAVL